MKNEKFAHDWEQLTISEETESRILDKIQQRLQPQKNRPAQKLKPVMKTRKKFKPRNILIAVCAVTMIFMLSAFGVIAQFGILIFDVFNVNKVDTIIIQNYEPAPEETALAEFYFSVTDPKVKPSVWVQEYFATFEKAEEHLDFNLKCLNYMPEDVSFKEIYVQTNNSCDILYERKHEDGYTSVFLLSQQYVGENAKIQINTTAEIEKIIINGSIEALLQTYERDYTAMYMLMWVKDNIGYTLSASNREELIKMAESAG